jgi:hypothetical protein
MYDESAESAIASEEHRQRTAPVQDDDADRTAWLIEMESDCLSRGSIAWFGIHYWHPTKGFSHEIDEALQFARKQDAEAFKREFKLSGKVVEHMWPASRLSPTPETGLVERIADIIRQCTDADTNDANYAAHQIASLSNASPDEAASKPNVR